MIEKRICQDCGVEFLGGDRALFCPDCRKREYGRRKNAAWKTILRRDGRTMEDVTQKTAEKRRKKRCRSCYYHGDMAGWISCEYILVMGKKRQSPPEDEKEGVRCGAYIEMKEGVEKYGERKWVDV